VTIHINNITEHIVFLMKDDMYFYIQGFNFTYQIGDYLE